MIDWIKDHLVPEARAWKQLWSTRLLGVAALIEVINLASLWGMMPNSVRAINPVVFDGVQLALVLAAMVARYVKQKNVTAKVRPNPDVTTAA